MTPKTNNVDTIFRDVYATCIAHYSKDTPTDLENEQYQQFRKEIFDKFDTLKPSQIGDLFCYVDHEIDNTKYFGKTITCNSIKNLLGSYTILKLSSACAISEEETIKESNSDIVANHTEQEKESARTEINDILSSIPVENLAEIYPLIEKEHSIACKKIKMIGRLPYYKPIEVDAIPIVNDLLVKEVAQQIPQTVITSQNQGKFKKMYHSMSNNLLRDTLDSQILLPEICKTYEEAKNTTNRDVVNNCSKMIDIMTDIEIQNLIHRTTQYLSHKNVFDFPSSFSHHLIQKDINKHFSNLYNNKITKHKAQETLSNIYTEQTKKVEEENLTPEECESAKLTIKACEYIFNIEMENSTNQAETPEDTTIASTDGADDDNIM